MHHPLIHAALAQAHLEDLRRTAANRTRAPSARTFPGRCARSSRMPVPTRTSAAAASKPHLRAHA